MVYKRLGVIFLFVLFAFPVSASTVSLLLVETGLNEEAANVPYSTLWEGGIMSAFFDAGHIITNSPIARMERKPAGDFSGIVEDDFNAAVSAGADYFVLGFLDFKIQGERVVPAGIILKVYTAGSKKLLYEQNFPAGTGKNLEEEYRLAQDTGQRIIPHLL